MNDMQFFNVKSSSELLILSSLIGVKGISNIELNLSFISEQEKSHLLFPKQADKHSYPVDRNCDYS